MKIIWKQDGSRNYLSDQGNDIYLNYNGKIGIETRGSTSQLLQKKQQECDKIIAELQQTKESLALSLNALSELLCDVSCFLMGAVRINMSATIH